MSEVQESPRSKGRRFSACSKEADGKAAFIEAGTERLSLRSSTPKAHNSFKPAERAFHHKRSRPAGDRIAFYWFLPIV